MTHNFVQNNADMFLNKLHDSFKKAGELQQGAFIAGPLSQATNGLEEWNSIVGDAFTGSVVDSSRNRFDAELWRCQINDMRLVRVRAQPSTVRRWLHDGPQRTSGSVLLHLQSVGHSVNQQRGNSVAASPGEGTLCDPDFAYTVDFPTPYEMFIVEIPMAGIVERDPNFDLERFAGHKVDTHRSQLLLSFLRTAWIQRECLESDADWRDCVSRTSLDLAMRSISQSEGRTDFGPSHELRRAVIEHIRKNLGDPDLRTSTIASALKVSPRTIQTVFERLATTASGFILEKRLDIAAQRLLQKPGSESMTVLAYDCGFSDSAYFSRCFRRQYGVAPRNYGRAGLTNQQ